MFADILAILQSAGLDSVIQNDTFLRGSLIYLKKKLKRLYKKSVFFV